MKKILILAVMTIFFAIGVNAAFLKVNTYSDDFSDVKNSSWYADSVKTAYELGFMNGKSESNFDPDGKVTIAEALAMATRLHALYNGKEIKPRETLKNEYRIDFDDPSALVDLKKRNSRNDNGINFFRAEGEIRDGMIVFHPDKPTSNGFYDAGLTFEGLRLDTRNYNKITFRMKMAPLAGEKFDNNKSERTDIFFKTNTEPSIQENKCIKVKLDHIKDKTEWFEVSVDAFTHPKWANILTGLRFDAGLNNYEYYIDYIVFSKSENSPEGKWYEMYYDYAIDNGIIDLQRYSINSLYNAITRAELCELFLSALPEEYFGAINDIKGIPDVDRNDAQADAYLLLYKAGVLLGSDSEGNFNADSFIKRSETATIINRVALPEKRVKGSISADWGKDASVYDLEFNDNSLLPKISREAKSFDISEGCAVIESLQRPNGFYDPKFSIGGLNINAVDYSRVRIRMKAEGIPEDVVTQKAQLFFMNVGDEEYTESKSVTNEFMKGAFVDAAGWYIIELDLRLTPLWKGTISSVRFDPSNTAGTYYIDYIRFISDDYYKIRTHEDLINAGYTATRLLQDEHFERGFYVSAFNQTEGIEHGMFRDYCETDEKPLWQIGPWWGKYDLIDDRDTTTDKYTLTDKEGSNTIIYNPEEKSVTMRVNATKIYEGKPYDYEELGWWAHLLIEQNTSFSPIDRKKNSAAADRMIAEIDIRCLDFKDTINPDGENTPGFFIYYYLMTDKAPGQRIWFGQTIMAGTNARSSGGAGWSPDSAAHQYIYSIPQSVVFGGMENCFNPENGVVVTGDEWKKVRLDVTPHIARAVEWANRDNIFGVPVTVEDMYFSGVNIGFETWGNYDYTFEFKNFNMVSYNKD